MTVDAAYVVAGGLSILGSSFIIGSFFVLKELRRRSLMRMVFYMAICDFFFALKFFVGGIIGAPTASAPASTPHSGPNLTKALDHFDLVLWSSSTSSDTAVIGERNESALCLFEGVLGQFFGLASISWYFCITINALYALSPIMNVNAATLKRREYMHHIFVWGISGVSTVIAGVFGEYGYDADGTCWIRGERNWFRMLFFFPLFVYIVVAMVLLAKVYHRRELLIRIRHKTAPFLRMVAFVGVFVALWIWPLLLRTLQFITSSSPQGIVLMHKIFIAGQGFGNFCVWVTSPAFGEFFRCVGNACPCCWAIRFCCCCCCDDAHLTGSREQGPGASKTSVSEDDGAGSQLRASLLGETGSSDLAHVHPVLVDDGDVEQGGHVGSQQSEDDEVAEAQSIHSLLHPDQNPMMHPPRSLSMTASVSRSAPLSSGRGISSPGDRSISPVSVPVHMMTSPDPTGLHRFERLVARSPSSSSHPHQKQAHSHDPEHSMGSHNSGSQHSNANNSANRPRVKVGFGPNRPAGGDVDASGADPALAGPSGSPPSTTLVTDGDGAVTSGAGAGYQAITTNAPPARSSTTLQSRSHTGSSGAGAQVPADTTASPPRVSVQVPQSSLQQRTASGNGQQGSRPAAAASTEAEARWHYAYSDLDSPGLSRDIRAIANLSPPTFDSVLAAPPPSHTQQLQQQQQQRLYRQPSPGGKPAAPGTTEE